MLDTVETTFAQELTKRPFIEVACMVTIDARFSFREFFGHTEEIKAVGGRHDKPAIWFQVYARLLKEETGIREMLY